MRNWLIRLLGGVTAPTWNQMLAENHLLREAKDREISYLRNLFADEQTRTKELQEIIFTRFGVTFPVQQAAAPRGDQKPIEISRESWPRKKSRLEAADLKKHLDDLTAQYAGRSTPMPPGNSPSENSGEHIPSSAQVGS
jgi:hypothetical protein